MTLNFNKIFQDSVVMAREVTGSTRKASARDVVAHYEGNPSATPNKFLDLVYPAAKCYLVAEATGYADAVALWNKFNEEDESC